ncbi:MAG: SufE family protein, partial [Proteiniphilum sp.]|nr:SufE family protein [Proteiniphilum sp.]
LDEKDKTPGNIIEGCQSRVWLQSDYRDGRLWFQAESDAIIVKGLLALVLRVFNGRTPDEIIGTDLRFMKEIGLTEHLSPTRSNGLLSVIKQIRLYAIAYKAKEEKQ